MDGVVSPWNQDKSKIPSFKVSDAVSSFAADQTVTVNVPNITAEDGKDVYVYLFAVDDNNVKATPLSLYTEGRVPGRPRQQL